MRLAIVMAATGLLVGCAHVAPAVTPAPLPAWIAYVPPEAKRYAEGRVFLAANATAPGVKTLPSGVQYKVTRSGPEGGQTPTADDDVVIHYEGKLLDGTVFDSSYARKEQQRFPLGALIPGWIDAVQQMRPGDEWVLYIPPERAYGPRDRGPIPGNSVLEFRIELFGVFPAEGDAGDEFH